MASFSLWLLPYLLVVRVDVLFSARGGKLVLSSDCESIIKSVAKLSKRGADLARGGWLRRPTARGLGFEFRKLKGPPIGAAGLQKAT